MSQEIVAVVIQNPEQPIKAVSVPEPQAIVAVEVPSTEVIEIRAVTVPETATVKGVAVPADQLVAFATLSEVGPQGLSGYSGYSGKSGFSGYSGYSGFSGFSGYSGDPAQQSGYSGYSGQSGYSGFCGLSGYSGFSGQSGYSGFCGTSGYSGYCGASGQSGYSGFCGASGYSGFSGLSGYSGFSGSGLSGHSGYSGSGLSGYSGFSGIGTSGFSGYSGFSSTSGYSGFSSLSGYSGFCGLSGYSGFSGSGLSGYSGYCGLSGYSGFSSTSGYSGYSSFSGYSGFSGPSGYSGFCGLSGYSGFCGTGTSGFSGYSGDPAQQSGYSGYSGKSGYSGFCGTSGFSGFSGYSGFSGAIGIAGTQPYWPQDTASDIGTYNDILTTPEAGTETTASSVCNNNQVLIQAYASPSIGLGLTIIPSGEWTFDFFASVASLSLASDLVIKVYSRTSGGVETLLFTTTSPTFTSTSVTEYEWSVIEPEFAVSATDRLVIKVYGETAIPLNTTVAYTYLGQTHYSRIITSFTPVGISGFSGYSGFSGKSGYSGFCGLSGYSGFCGLSGYSGYSGSGISGYSGYSGSGLSGYSGFCGLSGYSGFCGLSGYSGFSGLSGYSGFSSTSGYSGFCGLSGYSGFCGLSGYSGFSGPGVTKLLVTQNHDMALLGVSVVGKSATITGTAGVGSSLFLNRLFLHGNMTITEVDMALGLQFAATNQGAGTMSRSMVIYSFGNSTSLASVFSISGTSAWATGTVTAGGNTSLTQFQAGWGAVGALGQFIQPMTFASSVLPAGEYVVGQLFDFAQALSTWTLSVYGQVGYNTNLQSFVTKVDATDTIGALSSGGLAAVSAFTGSGSVAALSNAGTLGVNNYELSSNTFVGSAASAIATATAISTKSFSIQARTIFSAAPSTAGVLLSTAMSAGSFIGTSGTLAAITGVFASFQSITYLKPPSFHFSFIGTGSTTSNFMPFFSYGIMSTGAIPVAITLTSTAVTYSGTVAIRQPWFALVGN